MEKFILSIFVLVCCFLVRAHADEQHGLSCSSIEGPFARAEVLLHDPAPTSESYTFRDTADLSYNYSGADLTCSHTKIKDLQCIGYWEGKEIAKLDISLNADNKLIATFVTEKNYGNKKIVLPCEFK